MQWKCKGAFSESLQLSFSSILHKIAQIENTGVVQLLKYAFSLFSFSLYDAHEVIVFF